MNSGQSLSRGAVAGQAGRSVSGGRRPEAVPDKPSPTGLHKTPQVSNTKRIGVQQSAQHTVMFSQQPPSRNRPEIGSGAKQEVNPPKWLESGYLEQPSIL